MINLRVRALNSLTDPTLHLNMDPDSTLSLISIWIWIQLSVLFGSLNTLKYSIVIQVHGCFLNDPDQALEFDLDPVLEHC